jgi:hypothetical protein
MGFRCPAQRLGAQSEPPWGQSLPRSFLQRLTHTTMERKIRRGPAIDVFIDYDGGHCRSSRQHPRGAHRRTSSSTTMVDAAGAPGSTPRGPAIDVFINYDGGATRAPGSTPRGASNRCVAKNLVPIASISVARHLPGDHNGQHYYDRQDKVSQGNIP